MQGSGMSRAVMKKRKKLSKLSGDKSLLISNIADQRTIDSSDEDDTVKQPPSSVKRTKMKESTEFNQLLYEENLNKSVLNDLNKESVEEMSNKEDVSLFTSYCIADLVELEDVSQISSAARSTLILNKIIEPISNNEFYSSHWEDKPLICNRSSKNKNFKSLFSKSSFKKVVTNQLLIKDIDISVEFYESKFDPKLVNEDLDLNEQISEKVIWDEFKKGSTVILIQPQKFSDIIWKLLSSLEHEFDCLVHSKIYISPTGSINSELKYDNFDIFILQLEGSSQFSLYKPFEEFPLDGGFVDNSDPTSPVMHSIVSTTLKYPLELFVEVTLNEGDSMYIPKGWIYQHKTSPTAPHSLNLHVLTNKQNALANITELALPQAIALSISNSISIRRSLPKKYRSLIGVVASENDNDKKRTKIQKQFKLILQDIASAAFDMLDPASDQHYKKFILERLPVPLSKAEESCSYCGAPNAIIYPYTKLRMVRPGIAAAIIEDGMVVVYHCMDNSRELFGAPQPPVEFEQDDGPAIEMLLLAYPDGVIVSDLPHSNEETEDKVAIAQSLYKEGFLMIVDEASKPDVQSNQSDDSDSPF
eukprot:gene6297-8673_t